MKKLTVVVLFGGQSSEHEVSCMSAANMIAALDEGTGASVMALWMPFERDVGSHTAWMPS